MPFILNTPESLIQRTDSKNPAATCAGLTGSGRPCRRDIGLTQRSRQDDFTKGFCWQHKEQAERQCRGRVDAGPRKRTSTDTLVDRLGLLDLHEGRDGQAQVARPSQRSSRNLSKKGRAQTGLWCCIGLADEEPLCARPIWRTPAPSMPKSKASTSSLQHGKSWPQPPYLERPVMRRDPSTKEYLRLIPKSSSPQMTSQLLAELAKPISEYDEEGYIYIFWLTADSLTSVPTHKTARSLLDVSSKPDAGTRRVSNMLHNYKSDSSITQGKVLLKIGRTSNVQRRLNEWSRQCGYNLSLVRYYPYEKHSSSVPPGTPMKVPCAHKVEKLIHLELAEQRAKGGKSCAVCGRTHREWFEVDANREGVRAVDETVRRWVDWALKS